jgi:hypothetical protein
MVETRTQDDGLVKVIPSKADKRKLREAADVCDQLDRADRDHQDYATTAGGLREILKRFAE